MITVCYIYLREMEARGKGLLGGTRVKYPVPVQVLLEIPAPLYDTAFVRRARPRGKIEQRILPPPHSWHLLLLPRQPRW